MLRNPYLAETLHLPTISEYSFLDLDGIEKVGGLLFKHNFSFVEVQCVGLALLSCHLLISATIPRVHLWHTTLRSFFFSTLLLIRALQKDQDT